MTSLRANGYKVDQLPPGRRNWGSRRGARSAAFCSAVTPGGRPSRVLNPRPNPRGPIISIPATSTRPFPSAAHRAPDPARSPARLRGRSGFTYIELLVSLGVVGVLVALLVPVIGKGRASAQSAYCLSQLRQIATGFFQYAADNNHRLPDPFVAQKSWEQLLRRYVTSPETFRCPGDEELFGAVGSSYDWRDTGSPDTTLAGRLIDDSARSDCVLAFEALPAWHARGRMNAALLNGAAVSMDQELCMGDIQSAIRNPPRDERGKPAPKIPPVTAVK